MGLIQHCMHAPMTISDNERAFFIDLGLRVAELRKQHNITQVQLAEMLAVSQQTMQGYEVGRRRIPVSALPLLASALSVSLETLMGAPESRASTSKRGPTPKFQKQMEQIALLPRARQLVVMGMLDGVLAQRGASR